MHSQDVPQAVSETYFRKICPNATILKREELANRLEGATVLQSMNIWSEKLSSMEDRCVEIPNGTPQVFNYLVFGSKDILALWSTLSQSPIITQLGWSSLVYSAFRTNHHFFEHKSPKSVSESDLKISLPPFPHIDGLLAVHLRRGDYSGHCKGLASWSSEYNGFNRFDELPDKFQVPGGEWSEKLAIYLKHCYPTVSQVVEKVSSVREKVTGLKRLYVMTNGDREWVNELIRELGVSKKWEAISSSLDLSLTREQRFISQALDMYVAQRAEAFIGNGVSVSWRFCADILLTAPSSRIVVVDGVMRLVVQYDLQHCHAENGRET
ncbi:hypothetical protein APHAL10511_002377 [Amanita phalloides]|nr:hypothetical protein APHAL10511_002377 [Amanita phalloides]